MSSLAWLQSVSAQNLPLSGPLASRLVADPLSLAILWVLALAASQQISNNGRGSSLLRSLLGQNRTQTSGNSPHGARDPFKSYLNFAG